MNSTPIAATTPAASTPPASTSGLPSGQTLNNMFLQLLVAQLQNQDPTSPLDPSQFVGQLAQFSELSEVTSIYTLLQGVVPTKTGAAAGGTATPQNAAASSAANSALPAAASAVSALPAAASSPITSLPDFTSPSLSALAGKIKGAF